MAIGAQKSVGAVRATSATRTNDASSDEFRGQPACEYKPHRGEHSTARESTSTPEPLVSIIVPVFNAAEHLDRCVTSLLNQRHRNIEVLLIDDGSDDGSGGICDRYQELDPRVRVLHSQHRGVSHARNIGIGTSRGDYVQFVDADDFVASEMTTSLVNAQRAADADLVITGFVVRDSATDEQRAVAPEERVIAGHNEVLFGLRELRSADLVDICWNKLYRRSTLTAGNHRFSESEDFAEDALFNLSYLKNVSVVAVAGGTPYVYMRHTPGKSLSTKYQPEFYRVTRAQQDAALELYREAGIDTVELEREYAVTLATQVTPYFAKRIGRSDYEKYARLAAQIRQDETYCRHSHDLRPTSVRSGIYLILFRWCWFRAILVLGEASGIVRSVASTIARRFAKAARRSTRSALFGSEYPPTYEAQREGEIRPAS